MRYIVTLGTCVLLFGFGIQPKLIAQTTTTEETTTVTTEKKTKKKNAVTLVSALQKADLNVFKLSKKSAKLSQKKKAQRPYWLGLKTINTKSKAMKKALASKDKSFFKLLTETGVAVTEVNTGVSLMGIKDKDILRGVKALTVAYHQLYRNYGKEAARRKKGGDLTKKESEQLTRMETEAKTVETKLKTMRRKVVAQKKKNPRLVRQLDKAIKTSKKLSHKKTKSVSAYTEKLRLSNSLRNNWRSLGTYTKTWYPSVYKEWNTQNTSINTYIEHYDNNVTNIEVNDWSYVNDDVEVWDTEDTHESFTDEEVATDEKDVDEFEEKDATEETKEEELDETETTDTTSDDETHYDETADEDGDGITNSEDKDDDADGTTDEKDTDDDGDGVTDEKDEDSRDDDSDGVTNSEDKDDDGDGTTDEKDTDDDGDNVPDEKEEDHSSNDDSSSDDNSSSSDDNSSSSDDNSSSNDDNSSSNDDNSSSNDDTSSNDDSGNEPPPDE